ncbi:MAG: glycosyltransferase [Nitrospiria bacterium]
MLTTSYPRSTGDFSGVFVFRLCRALVASKVQVDVVAPADDGGYLEEEVGGSRVYRFGYFFPRKWQRLAYGGGIPANLNRNPWLIAQVPFFILMFIFKSLRVTKGADVVHAQWIYTGLIALVVKMVRGIPFIVTLNGSDVLLSRKGRFACFVSLWILKKAALITTVSQHLRKWVVAQGIPENRVIFLRNGVDLRPNGRREKASSPFRLIYVGSLIPGKGVRYLIEALSHIDQKEKEICLVVIGEGREKEQLQRRVDMYGLGGAVEFVGAQPPDQIPYWMSRSDCLVLPSLWEGTPNVVLEAMACGLPVVASDLPGIREVVNHGVHGLLAEPKDVAGLAQNLLKMIKNKELRLQMGRRGQKAIVEMGIGWDQVARQYREVYKRLCAAL